MHQKLRGVLLTDGEGRYSCPGQNLALFELRLVVARLVGAFYIRLAEGVVSERILREVKDCFTAVTGPVGVGFTAKYREVRPE